LGPIQLGSLTTATLTIVDNDSGQAAVETFVASRERSHVSPPPKPPGDFSFAKPARASL